MAHKKSKNTAKRETSVQEHAGAEAYQQFLSPLAYAQLQDALASVLPQAVRVNTLKIREQEARTIWPERYGWTIQPVQFCPAGWQILAAQRRPSQTSEFKLGFFYIQDAASMLPVELFDWQEGAHPLILDLAAAPGGKSTHLVSQSGDRGLLLANDSSYGRIPALRAGLQDWGAINALVTNLPGERFGDWYPELFDRVLLDAPCSMDNLRPAGGHGKRVISAREHQSLAQRQIQLLASAVRAVKPGGQIVYSTCTLAPEEDEGVLDAILQLFAGLVEIEPVAEKMPVPAPALVQAGERKFLPAVQNGLRLWPHLYGTSGFFSARLRKLDSLGLKASSAPFRPFEKQHLTRLGRPGQQVVLDHLHQLYGFDFNRVMADQQLSLWKRAEAYYALPDAYLAHFADLPVEMVGFLIGDETRDGWIPSHELVARFGRDFTQGKIMLSTVEAASWLTGVDLYLDPDYPVGTVLAVEDEHHALLGRGKVLVGKLKNMLPRRLAAG